MESADDRREALRRTYRKLGVGELVAAAMFAFIALAKSPDDWEGRAAAWSALAPLLVILVQAGVYWLLARAWVDQRPMPHGLANLYRSFRVLDPVLLLAGLVGVLAWAPDRTFVTVLLLAVWAFGAVEFVNYFVVRLAYPPRQWLSSIGQWRTPRLVLDMTHRRRNQPS